MTNYLVTNTRRAQRNDIFFEKKKCLRKNRELFLKKNPHIFMSEMKKKFYYKNLKITTTEDTNVNF